MKTYGKNINLFLMDGTSNGRIKCTLANWTGVAYKIPRVDLDLCKEREDLKQSGVYFLFGESDNQEQIVYVGQAGIRKSGEGILKRLYEHRKNIEKDYWTEAIVLTTSNNSFGPTEIGYLENRFFNIATESHRYIVKNIDEPTQGNVTEEKESELEEFIEFARIIIGVLGHSIEPFTKIERNKDIVTQPTTEQVEGTVFYIKSRGVQAKAIQISDGFVVLAGSTITKDLVKSCQSSTLKARDRYKQFIDSDMKLLKDIKFNSPSGASSFVLGRPSNGKTDWVTANGVNLSTLESI